MKVTRIRIYKTPLPYVGGVYAWGAGNAIDVAMASVVGIDTDAGLQGCGEFTPCGENYMVAHSEGVEALARIISPKLLGEDPRLVARIEHLVQGHGYTKGGKLYAPDAPGLGVTPDFNSLGAPVADYAEETA